MRIKSKASKLISVLLVAVMIVTTVSVSFAETEQISDVTTPAAQEVDVLSASDDSSAKASDANQASDVQASDVQASGTQESGTDATDSTEAADSNVTSTEGETEEDVILSSESDEEAVEEGIALLAEQGYTIKFNRNGGSGTAPADITTDEDGNFTFPGKGSMSRSGYTFMGWGRSTTTGHCDTSDGSIPKNATNYSIYEPGEKGSASRDMKYYAVWARSESAQYFIRLDGTVPREPGDYSTSLYTDQIGTGKTVALNTFYANSNIADNGVASHLGNTPTTAEIMNACNAKASSIIFSDGSRYERCSTTGDFEKKYYVIWYVVKLAGTIHVDGSLLKKSLYNVTYEPNAKAGEYTGTVPATKQYAAGQKVTVEKSNLQREGYTFVGWESSIDGKTYNAGSKFTMPENNVVLKAIWAREGNLSYTVNYLDQSTGDAIADPKVVGDKHYGDEVTETAIDIDGYDKVEPVSETITISKGENVINFYYTKRTDLSYTVNYLEQGTNKVLADAKTVNKQTFNAEITEGAIDIAGYNKVDPTSKTITIGTGSNVINFYYTKRTDLTYTVNYLEYGTNKVLHDPKTVENQVLDSTASESAIDIAGYNKKAPTSVSIKIAADRNIINFYYEKRTDLEYTVNYLEKGTDNVLATAKSVKNQTFGTTVEEEAITINGYNLDSAAKQSIQIGTGTNVINFYYTKRTDLSYTVNYLEKDTNKVLEKAKKEGNQTFGDKIDVSAIDIEGYDKVAPTTAEIEITTGTNEHTFYYTKRTDLSYTINYYKNSVRADSKLGDTVTVDKQTYLDEVSLDSDTINARKPSSDYYDGEVSADKIVIKVSGNNFDIVYKKKPEMSIEAAGYEGKYDGAAHSGTVTSSAEKGETVYTYYQIIGDETKKLDSAPSVTDVQRDAEGNVITLHYMVEASNDEYSAPEPAYFDIKITPLQISIFWARNINYDGLVHTFEIGTSKDQTEDGVLEGETLYHNATISGQAAGTYDKVSDYSWCVYKSDEKTDSTVNYDIKIGALLTISKARPDTKLRLDIDSYKGVYDGQEHERLAIFQAPAGIAASTEIQYSRDGKNWTTDVPSIKNVGKETCYVRAYNESFIDDEYPMKEYTLEVTPRNLIIYAEAEYMYDGEEKVLHITADDMADMDTGNEGLVDGEFLSLENALIKGTEPGVYTKVSEYSAEVFKMYSKPADDEAALMVDADAAEVEVTTENYNIQVAGKLTITSLAANDPAGKNAKGDSDKGSGNGTKTGDTTPVGILFGLLALAACGGGFAAFGRRKREE